MDDELLEENDTYEEQIVQKILIKIAQTITNKTPPRPPKPQEIIVEHINTPLSDIFSCESSIGILGYHSLGIRLASLSEEFGSVRAISLSENPVVSWVQLPFTGEKTLAPTKAAFLFPSDTLAAFPVAVALIQEYETYGVKIYTAIDHRLEAQSLLENLLKEVRGVHNFYRGRMIHATRSFSEEYITLSPLEIPNIEAKDLFFPPSIWKAIETNVYGFFENTELLKRLSENPNRGVVLAGPPGTGKTDLSQLIVKTLHEKYREELTVIYCDSKALNMGFEWLYSDIAEIGKTVVILEDIDLFLANRNNFGGNSLLLNFLTSLDGIGTHHSNVLTLATTNDIKVIDAAAKRPSRLDVILEIPPPDATTRAQILSRSLAKVDIQTSASSLAKVTEGATGASLMELIRQGLLIHGTSLTEKDLVEIAKKMFAPNSDPRFVGNYV